ncbi:hypothetical protein ATANTOWER_012271 [Ataeniobius toweri]|uniref:Uncharacterized protein n=1 Tax=Ataeniobius toweri TaxID=208326 RepID=A0ABU7BY76_9TELE|nr:hypothetical protein [Ataeniobius toweri]
MKEKDCDRRPAETNCVPEFPAETLSLRSRVEQFFPGLRGRQQEPHPVVTCSVVSGQNELSSSHCSGG